MIWFACLYLFLAGLLVFINLVWYRRFNKLFRVRLTAASSDALPLRALVVLTLRGADPFLPETLNRLARQTWKNFKLRIIIDSETDPAWQAVNHFLSCDERPETEVQILGRRLPTCSLKASALLQAMSPLAEEFDAVVQIDADAVPYSNWMSEMLAPFHDPDVGAVSGLRWYTPEGGNLATRMRQIWGSGAMVQMYAGGMAWGGSLALRREFLEQSDLFQRWAHCLAEDMAVSAALNSASLKLAFAPAILSNQEETKLAGCFEFIRRQLFQVRWQHHSWWLVAAYTWLLMISSLTGVVAFTLAIQATNWALVAGLSAALTAYVLIYAVTLKQTEHLVRNRLRAQGESCRDVGPWYIFDLFPTGCLFASCFLSACFIRTIRWRGVAYRALSRNRFQLLTDSARPSVQPVPELPAPAISCVTQGCEISEISVSN